MLTSRRAVGARGSCLHSFAGANHSLRWWDRRQARLERFFDPNDVSQFFGSSRDVIKSRYALITPNGFVPSAMPGWRNCITSIVIFSRGIKF